MLFAITAIGLPAAAQKAQDNVTDGTAGDGDIFEIDGNLAGGDGSPVGDFDWTPLWPTAITDPESPLIVVDGPMVWLVDGIKGADASVFAKSDKVFHDPSTYNWKTGSTPPKDDMNNCLFYLFMDEAGDVWGAMGGDRRAINGSSYIDFEFLQKALIMEDDGSFTTFGLDGGRTDGDLLATIQLQTGGDNPKFFLQRWTFDDNEKPKWDYRDIDPLEVTPGGGQPDLAHVASNQSGPAATPFPAFGNNSYETNQFGESAVNLTGLMDIGLCETIATLFIRTKSSPSSTAQLKDFCPPIQLNLCFDMEDPVIESSPTETGSGVTDFSCDDAAVIAAIAADLADGDETNDAAIWAAVNFGVVTYSDNSLDLEATFGGFNGDPVDTCPPLDELFGVVITIPSPPCPGEYDLDVTWTVTDACNNSASVTVQFNVRDDDAPDLTCEDDLSIPNEMEIECNTVGGFSAIDPESLPWTTPNGNDNVDDNCDTDPSLISSLSAGAAQGPFAIPAEDNPGGLCGVRFTKTWTITDCAGNSDSGSQCTQIIDVVDTTNPILTCKADPVSAFACVGPEISNYTQHFSAPEIGDMSDNCTPSSSLLATLEVVFPDVKTGVDNCSFDITRTWRITDDCGLTATCTQTIRITDMDNPRITAPPDDVQECVDGNFAITFPLKGTLDVDDDCVPDELLVVTFQDSAKTPVVTAEGCGFEQTRTWTVTDVCGNQGMDSMKITVLDTVDPMIFSPGNQMAECDVTKRITFTASDVCDSSPTIVFDFTDCDAHPNCSATEISNGVFDITMTGTQDFMVTIFAQAVDACGNDSAQISIDVSTDCFDPDICGPGRPDQLIMQYTGIPGCTWESCREDKAPLDPPNTPQSENCEDRGGVGGTMWVIATDKDLGNKSTMFFNDGQEVAPGDDWLVNGIPTAKGNLVGNTLIYLYDSEADWLLDKAEIENKNGGGGIDGRWLQMVKFHTSCSACLLVGDTFGSNTIVDFHTELAPDPFPDPLP